MDLATILTAINEGLKVLALAVKAKEEVTTILADIERIKSWLAGTTVPTDADFTSLAEREAALLATINDTSGDD